MAKAVISTTVTYKRLVPAKRTSIGHSHLTRPTNKSARRSYKAYRGQGKP